jgi:hypothetical protein
MGSYEARMADIRTRTGAKHPWVEADSLFAQRPVSRQAVRRPGILSTRVYYTVRFCEGVPARDDLRGMTWPSS